MSDFSVSENVLVGAEQISPLTYHDKTINPKYIAIHYTSGGTLDSSINYLRESKLSYQILIGRDGRVVQGAPLNKRASHAGYSNWKGLDNMNDYSIGISLANIGYLERHHGDRYYRTNGHGDRVTNIFDKSKVVVARHWNGHNGATVMGWEKFTDPQYEALIRVCRALKKAFPEIRDATSHEEIAIGRKPDPGMAFEWDRLHSLFPKRPEDLGPTYVVRVPPNDMLMVRNGPNKSWGVKDKLPNGTRVHVRSYAYIERPRPEPPIKTTWASVAMYGQMNHHGFVDSSYLHGD